MSAVKYCSAIAVLSVLLSACDGDPLGIEGAESSAVPETGNTDFSGGTGGTDSTSGSSSGIIEDDEYWAVLAQDYPAFVVPPEIGAAHDASENINLGRWGDLIEWPQIATGAAHMPDGRLLTWSSTRVEGFGTNTAFTHGSIFDPVTESFTDMPNDNHNMFCSGVAMLPDGNVLTSGGGATITTNSVFDGNSWSLTDSLNTPRWYPTSTTLPSGQVFIALGKTTANSELWTEGEGWRTLPRTNLQQITSDTAAKNNQRTWFPAFNVAPDGSLFHPGPTTNLLSLDLYTNGSTVIPHGKRESEDQHRLYNTTVMYDIGKMLVAGGGQPAVNTAMTIDLNGTTPVVTATEPMTYERSMQDSVVLPNGQVLVIGGNSSGIQFSDEGTQLFPELWDPDTGQWQVLAPHSRPRNYHSTAMLLKDGRVAAMGSGLCGNCATNQRNGEIFEPPYLFNNDGTRATRPQIASGPAEAIAGQALQFSATAGLQTFSMVRLMALTHHHSTDQRFIPLGFVETSNGNYNVQLPSNSNVLIPGYYWVFGLNQNGVPSEGHTIMINPTAENVPEPPSFISFEYYEGEWDELPDFDALTPVATGETGDFSTSERLADENFGFRFSATISITEEGNYTFFTNSDDGSQLFVNGRLVVDNDGLHASREAQGSVGLSAGTHEIVVTYFEKGGLESLSVQMQGPLITKQSLAAFLVPLDDQGNQAVPVEQVIPFNPTAPAAPSTPSAPSQAVIAYEYYEGTWAALPDFDALTPVATGELTEFSTDPKEQARFFGFRYNTTLYVSQADEYTFYTVSDDGSALYVNGQLVVDNDGLHRAEEQQGSINLTAGEHDIVVEYFQRSGGQTLEVSYESGAVNRQALLPSAAPVIAPSSPENPDNLVSNGGFNTDLSDWVSCGGQATVSGGTASLSSGGCLFQEFSVTPNATYTLRCDAAAPAGFASVQLSVSDASFAALESELVAVTSTSGAPITTSVVAPAGSVQGAVTLYAADQANFDNCIVLEDLATTVPVAVEPAVNELLINSTFTNNLDGWFGCGGQQTLTTDGVNGGQSVNLTNSGCLFQEFTLIPGAEYSLACVGKSNDGFASVSFIEYDSTFAELSSQQQQVVGRLFQNSAIAITASDNARYGAVTLFGESDASFDSCGVVITGGVTPEPVVVVDPADNLLSNGDFSNGGTEWLSCGGSTEIEALGPDNTDALVLGTTSCAFQEFEATPGSEYAVSCSASSTAFASLTIGFSDVEFTGLASNESSVAGTAFTTVVVGETAPAGTARGAVTLYADDSAVFDNCAVVEL